jgi:guanylate kinase
MSDKRADTTTGTLYIIAAPSGAGKTSLVKALLGSTALLTVSVSHTTRPMRPGEIDGKDYCFIDVDTFRAMENDGSFIESAQVFDNFYGTSRSATLDQLQRGVDVILEIDWQGAQQVRELMPDAVSIFILPPSREALEQRLKARKQDGPEVIARRMSDAVNEISHYTEFDYIVVNEDMEVALTELRAIILARRLRQEPQAVRNQKIINGLLV